METNVDWKKRFFALRGQQQQDTGKGEQGQEYQGGAPSQSLDAGTMDQSQQQPRLAEDSFAGVTDNNNSQAPQQAQQQAQPEQPEQPEGRGDMVERTLDQIMPEWRQITESPAFEQWLSGMEQASGRSYGELLHEAYSGGQVDRVLWFMQAFTAEAEMMAQQQQQQAVSPITGGSPQATGGNNQHSALSGGEIQQFYQDVQKGKYTPEQVAEIERTRIFPQTG